jgi:quinol monooxygenase YgiN
MEPNRTTDKTDLTTLDPSDGHITTINTYTVAPERAEEVLKYLVQSAEETVRHVPGFLSFNFHLSLDRTRIVNYGQWESREALMDARENPKIVALMAETAKIAGSSNSMPYVLRKSVPSAGR